MSSIIPLDYLSHFSLYYFGCIEFGWYVQRTLHSPVPFTEWHSVFSRTIETGMHVTCIMATSQCPTCNALIIPNEWKFLLQLYNTHNHQISRWMFPSDIFRLLFFFALVLLLFLHFFTYRNEIGVCERLAFIGIHSNLFRWYFDICAFIGFELNAIRKLCLLFIDTY